MTSVEWSPYESSMLATSGADNSLAVWDLALERDPEEEQALAPEGNAVPQVRGHRGGGWAPGLTASVPSCQHRACVWQAVPTTPVPFTLQPR